MSVGECQQHEFDLSTRPCLVVITMSKPTDVGRINIKRYPHGTTHQDALMTLVSCEEIDLYLIVEALRYFSKAENIDGLQMVETE